MDENHFLILPLLSKDLDKTGGERGILLHSTYNVQQDEVPWRKKTRVEVREEVEEEGGAHPKNPTGVIYTCHFAS